MANSFRLELDGLNVIIESFDGFIAEFEEKLEETMTRIALKIIADARRLAPLDEGDLEAALNVDEVKRTINLMYIDFGTSPEVDHYAVIQHEGFMVRNDKVVPLTPGEKTRSKPAHGGYMPGKKYLENAIKMNEKWIIEELSKALNMEGW